MASKLSAGDTFPNIDLTLTDGNTLSLPDEISSKYKVVLFYRGHW